MSVLVLALVTINEAEPYALAKYLDATIPLLDEVGAKIIQRFDVNEVVVGRRPAHSVMIVEYPDREAVDKVFTSATYKSIVPYRDKAFLDYHISVVVGDVEDIDATSRERPRSDLILDQFL